MGSGDKDVGNRLYLYSTKELSQLLDRIGFPDFPVTAAWDVSRNADGSALRFYDWSNNKAVIISCDGHIKMVRLPGPSTWSEKPLWFDKRHEVYAWWGKGEVNISNKKRIREPSGEMVDEPHGEYYFRHIAPHHRNDLTTGTAIYSIDKPNAILAKVDIIGKQIFSKNGNVFLFGNISEEREEQEEIHVFKKKNNKLVQIDKHVIKRPAKSPAPFNVEDISPWSDEVLFCDVYDFPARSKWYLYDMDTRELNELRKKPFSGGWGFFLQCDIVGKTTAKKK